MCWFANRRNYRKSSSVYIYIYIFIYKYIIIVIHIYLDSTSNRRRFRLFLLPWGDSTQFTHLAVSRWGPAGERRTSGPGPSGVLSGKIQGKPQIFLHEKLEERITTPKSHGFSHSIWDGMGGYFSGKPIRWGDWDLIIVEVYDSVLVVTSRTGMCDKSEATKNWLAPCTRPWWVYLQ